MTAVSYRGPAELEARQREGFVLAFVETLLRKTEGDIATLINATTIDDAASSAIEDIRWAIAMAGEYLEELRGLADRPIAGTARAA